MWAAPDQPNNSTCEMITYVSSAQMPCEECVKINYFFITYSSSVIENNSIDIRTADCFCQQVQLKLVWILHPITNVCYVKIRSRLQNDPFRTISSHFFCKLEGES